jgi:Holliday junction resolvase RusA-like endonuclease
MLDLKSKSRNEIDKMHWAVKRRLRKEYCLLIRNQMRLKNVRKAGGNSVYELHITCYRKRKLDYDNLVGGLKQLIDALWYEGFIFDDNEKHCCIMNIIQVKASGERIGITRKLP